MEHLHILFAPDDTTSGGTADSVDVAVDATPADAARADDNSATRKATIDWEKRYKGLQRANQRLHEELDSAVTKYEAELAKLKNGYTKAQADLAAALKEKSEVAAQLEEKAAALSKRQREIDVLNAINDPENPDLAILAPLFKKGLLAVDDLEGEELETYLQEYAETLGSLAGDSIRQKVAGAKAGSATGTTQKSGKSLDELLDDLMGATPGTEEYQTIQLAYFQALEEAGESE